MASQTEIPEVVIAAMLPRDNVLNVEIDERKTGLSQSAILTMACCEFSNITTGR